MQHIMPDGLTAVLGMKVAARRAPMHRYWVAGCGAMGRMGAKWSHLLEHRVVGCWGIGRLGIGAFGKGFDGV